MWVANSGDGRTCEVRCGPARRTKPRRSRSGASPQDVVVAAGRVWVSVRPRARDFERRIRSAVTVETPDAPSFLFWGSASTTPPWTSPIPPAPSSWPFPASPVPLVRGLCPNSPRRSRCGRRGGRSLHLHPEAGLPVLATVRGAGDRAEHEVHDRAGPEPAPEVPGALDVSDLVGQRAVRGGTCAPRLRHPGPRQQAHAAAPSIRPRTSEDRLAQPFFCAVMVGTPIDLEGRDPIPSAGPPTSRRTLLPSREVVAAAESRLRGLSPEPPR